MYANPVLTVALKILVGSNATNEFVLVLYLSPGVPVEPAGPVGPVGPVFPLEPVAPAAPAGPVLPSGP